MSCRKVITIDGLAASGKSTLAKLLAKELGYIHLNTGLLYRACAYMAIKENISPEDEASIVDLILKHSFDFKSDNNRGSILLIDGQDCEKFLQSQEVSNFTSKIAAFANVRKNLKDIQKNAFLDHSIVAEGRDTGTVIFPEAQVKFFIEGDPLVRASRRAKDLMGALSEAELKRVINSVAQELSERDARDANRLSAPLKRAEDSIIIDNTKSSLESTVADMLKIVQQKIL